MRTNDTPAVLTSAARIWASLISFILLLAGPVYAQSYTIAPPPFQLVQNDSGQIVVGGCVWTYAAGTTNPIATYSTNSGSLNSNPIVADYAGRFTAYLLAGTNYKFVYEQACTPPAHGATLRTADNIAGVPASAATVDMTCTAGETISASQAVYVSDGSGSKTQGYCYKADIANGYSSSTATVVGLAPAAIASGLSGTVRIAGPVAGLASLSVGAPYYIGSGGALTTTAPAGARAIGAADTATSLILSLPQAAQIDNSIDDFRLTLTTTTPVTTADVTAATTLYASPYRGNRLALADSTGTATIYRSAEFSIAIPATTSQMYDVFAFSSSGVPTLELLAWTNDTTRATAIVLTTTGFYTKSGDLTRRYLGSVRTSTVSGQTEDSATKRYLWNYYNRVRRVLFRADTTDTWNYTLAPYQQANASAANQVEVVVGVAETLLSLRLVGVCTNSSGVLSGQSVAIGEDSTTAAAANQLISRVLNTPDAATLYRNPSASLDKYPAVGRHFYAWLEQSSASGTTTWRGDDGTSTVLQSGLSGFIDG